MPKKASHTTKSHAITHYECSQATGGRIQWLAINPNIPHVSIDLGRIDTEIPSAYPAELCATLQQSLASEGLEATIRFGQREKETMGKKRLKSGETKQYDEDQSHIFIRPTPENRDDFQKIVDNIRKTLNLSDLQPYDITQLWTLSTMKNVIDDADIIPSR